MKRTVAEINERIKKGQAVVLTAEEVVRLVREKGVRKAAAEVDVVTTGTFGPMCSSGAIINTGHSKPRIKMQKAWFNDVEAYCGSRRWIATSAPPSCPSPTENRIHPGNFSYGGAHVIQELVAGKDVRFRAISYGTDCYPRKEIETTISLKTVNEAYLFNPRNCYQNYNCAINLSDRMIYTYMGVLKPNIGNANYCSAGQLSPLLKDTLYRTIGVGTRIFLGGGVGYVVGRDSTTRGAPNALGGAHQGAGTLAVTGDLKQMSPEFVVGVSFMGYG
jgi:uncharacterized protein (DUF39 family)